MFLLSIHAYLTGMKSIVLSLVTILLLHQAFSQNPKLVLPIGHPQGVTDIRVTADGRFLLSKSFNDIGTKVWDTRTGKLLHNLTIPDGSSLMRVNPSGKQVLLSGDHDSSFIFNLITGEVDFVIARSFDGAMYSSNGDVLLTSKVNELQLWEAATGVLLQTYQAEDSITLFGFINQDKQVLVERGPKNNVVYEVLHNDLKQPRSLIIPGNTGAYFSEFRDTLYATRFDGRQAFVHRLPYDSLKITGTITFDSIYKKPAMIRESNDNLLVAMEDSSLYLINITEEMIYPFNKFDYGIEQIGFIDSGRHFMVSDGYAANCFNTKTTEAVQFFAVSEESRNLKNVEADIAANDRNKKFYFVLADNVIMEYKITGDTSVFTQSFAGQTQNISTAVFQQGNMVIGDGESFAKFIDMNKAEVISSFEMHLDFLSSLSFSSQQQSLISSSWDSSVKIWDPVTKNVIKKIKRKFSIINAVVNDQQNQLAMIYRPDIMSFEDTGCTLELFDLKQNKTVRSFKTKDRLVAVNFSKDGRFLFYCNQSDSSVTISDLHLRPVTKLKSVGWVFEVRQTGSGKYLEITTDNGVELYEYKTGKLFKRFPINNMWGYHRASVSIDEKLIIAGTERGLINMWDMQSGELLYTVKIHSSGVIPSFVNDSSLVTSSEDGTIKYWRYNRQQLQLVYQTVPFKQNEYISTIPAGYYKGSQLAAKQLHYVTADAKIISFEQLDVKYNRPDKVLEAIGNKDTMLINSYKRAYYKRIKKLGIDTTQFNDGYSVPEAEFEHRDAVQYEQTNEQIVFNIKASDSTYLLDRFNIWINEVPLFGMKGISIRHRSSHSFDTSISIHLSQGENKIETSVTNANGTESYRMPLLLNYIAAAPVKETVHFIGIGINEFADSSRNLQWCVKDIRDLALKFKEKYGSNIIIDTLFNQHVTLSNVKAIKQKLLSTKINDKVVMAYSGHGLLSKQYDYYLSSFDVNFRNPEENGIAYEEIENLLDGIPARKKLLLIDACHSGEVDKDELIAIQNNKNKKGNKGLIMNRGSEDETIETKTVGLQNSFELMQSLFVNVGKGTGATIISAAGGVQFAQERDDLENGVFTFSLLEAMQRKTIKVSELKKYVGRRVEELTNGLQKPTTRNELKDFDWNVW
jgi:WD40 repeat protein